jgi:hypothetical protein
MVWDSAWWPVQRLPAHKIDGEGVSKAGEREERGREREEREGEGGRGREKEGERDMKGMERRWGDRKGSEGVRERMRAEERERKGESCSKGECRKRPGRRRRRQGEFQGESGGGKHVPWNAADSQRELFSVLGECSRAVDGESDPPFPLRHFKIFEQEVTGPVTPVRAHP